MRMRVFVAAAMCCLVSESVRADDPDPIPYPEVVCVQSKFQRVSDLSKVVHAAAGNVIPVEEGETPAAARHRCQVGIQRTVNESLKAACKAYNKRPCVGPSVDFKKASSFGSKPKCKKKVEIQKEGKVTYVGALSTRWAELERSNGKVYRIVWGVGWKLRWAPPKVDPKVVIADAQKDAEAPLRWFFGNQFNNIAMEKDDIGGNPKILDGWYCVPDPACNPDRGELRMGRDKFYFRDNGEVCVAPTPEPTDTPTPAPTVVVTATPTATPISENPTPVADAIPQ